MKWTAENLGPRQAKAFNQAIGRFDWESKTFTELYGTHGHPATERRTTLTSPFGKARPDAAVLLQTIGERHGWKVTGSTYQAIVADIEGAIKKMEDSRPVQDSRITQEEVDERTRVAVERDATARAANETAEKRRAAVAAIRPAWAKAAIIAELIHDDSDIMTDYHGEHTEKTVLIGWRRGDREDFRQLRAAAAGFPPTAHLGPGKGFFKVSAVFAEGWKEAEGYRPHYPGMKAPSGYQLDGKEYTTREEAEAAIAGSTEDMRLGDQGGASGLVEYIIHEEPVEHRENYSMGRGNYLQSLRNSPWRVSSTGLDVAPAEICIPESKPEEAPATCGASGATMSRNVEKDGLEIRFPEKPGADVLERVKAAGWRWSRFSKCWYTRYSEAAERFARELVGAEPAAEGEAKSDKPTYSEYDEANALAAARGDTYNGAGTQLAELMDAGIPADRALVMLNMD